MGLFLWIRNGALFAVQCKPEKSDPKTGAQIVNEIYKEKK